MEYIITKHLLSSMKPEIENGAHTTYRHGLLISALFQSNYESIQVQLWFFDRENRKDI